MKRLFLTFSALIISIVVTAQIEPVNIVSNINITTSREFVFKAQGSGPFVVSFTFYYQNGTTTLIKLYESTDNGRSYHAYPDMPSILIATLTGKASAFRDPWSCQATHLKVVVSLETGKRINGFYLSYKPN